MGKGPILGGQRDPAQIEHRQQVAVAEIVLKREAEHIELDQRGERFQAVQRDASVAESLLHVGPGGERPLAHPVVATVHFMVEDLQPVVAHPNGIGVREDKAKLSSHAAMIFHHGIDLAADVLPRSLHPRQHLAQNPFLERRFSKSTSRMQ